MTHCKTIGVGDDEPDQRMKTRKDIKGPKELKLHVAGLNMCFCLQSFIIEVWCLFVSFTDRYYYDVRAGNKRTPVQLGLAIP